MSLPSSRGKAATDLQAELDRRINYGEPAFDYFAPTYVAMHHRGGKLVKTERPLLYNYIFINSSVRELWRMKQRLPHFNFLRRTSSNTTPILLLDDIFDKLDAQRVEAIVKVVSGDGYGQIFITDTNRDHLDSILRENAMDYKIFEVESGAINLKEEKECFAEK